MLRESDILHETTDRSHWVVRGDKGLGHYNVMRNVGTHSVRCGIVHYSSDPALALERAIHEAERRAAA